jgi:hypothetical protein
MLAANILDPIYLIYFEKDGDDWSLPIDKLTMDEEDRVRQLIVEVYGGSNGAKQQVGGRSIRSGFVIILLKGVAQARV